jgi:hypothetical protein
MKGLLSTREQRIKGTSRIPVASYPEKGTGMTWSAVTELREY